MDFKDYKKQVKKNCHWAALPAGRKECMETVMCNWNHCQKEIQDKEAESKTCENEKDFSKQVDCRMKLIQKSDKIASLAHCEANKCPQVRAFVKKQAKEMAKRINKNIKLSEEQEERNKCIETHCSKEEKKDEEEKQKVDEKIFECQKKFATRKEQDKCDKQALKNKTKSFKNKYNCYDKYCKLKPSQSSKKTNKKTKNH